VHVIATASFLTLEVTHNIVCR